MPGQGGIENKLPVFTTPQQQITFYADDPLSFKQILTIYNPYDFLVKFRISCTDCSKYTVSAAQGSIKSNHSIDIVVHHKAVSSNNIGVSDTVRIQLYTSGQIRAGGKKDIAITLASTTPRERVAAPAIETERFQQLEADAAALGHLRQHPFIHERNTNGIVIYSIVIVICLILLSLPKVGDESDLPESIPRPTTELKLWVSFVLGAATVLLIRT